MCVYVCRSAAAAAKSLQSRPTLCDPVDGSPPGSLVPGILQARTLEWVAISFTNAWKWKVKGKSLGHVRLLVTRWTAAYQAPPSKGFSRQEYWSGLCLILWDPMDCSPPASSAHRIFQARILEWGCHLLLQGIFPIQVFNPSLLQILHWQTDYLPTQPPGKHLH